MSIQVGQNIKIIRTSKQKSQKELAAEVGVTPNYLSMIENNSKTPSLGLLQKISAALQIPVGNFFGELSLSTN